MSAFWRKCRTAFRWCRFTLWTVLVLAMLTFAWLDLVGLPDFLKARIVTTLQERGVSLQFTRMRFRPVHGLVVDQVTVGGMMNTNRAVFTAGEIQLRLDYAAMLHRKFQLDGLVVHNGEFVLPVSSTNSLTWQNIESTVRFLPEQTYAVDDLRSDFAGARLQVALQLAHAPEITNWAIFAGKTTTGPSSLAKPLQDFADQLQHIQFTGQPQFSLTFHGDARDVHTLRLQVNARIPDIKTTWFSARDLQFASRIISPTNAFVTNDPALGFWTNAYPFRLAWIARAAAIDSDRISGEKILCSGNWSAPQLNLTRLGAHLGNGILESTASLDVASRRLFFTNDSAFDPHLLSFLFPPAASNQLATILWTAPPSLKIGGSTSLPVWTNSQADWRNDLLTNLRLAGAAGFSNAVIHATPLDLARVHFDYQDQIVTLSDAELDQAATRLSLNGQQSLATKNFNFHLAGYLDPATVTPFLANTRATNALVLFQFNDPLALDVGVAGNLGDLPDATATGHIALTNFTVRGQTFGSVSSELNCSNRVLRFLNPQGYRANDSQYVTADSVTLDFNQMFYFFTNGYSTFEQMVIPRAIGPKTAGPIEPYQYQTPPIARVHGQLPIRDFKNGKDLEGTDMTFDIIRGAPFRWEKLYTTNITGTVHWLGQYLVLSNLNAQCYNGTASGKAYFDFTPVGYGCDFDFEVFAENLNVKALALGLAQNKTNRFEGLLSGHVVVTDANSKTWQSWDGYGSAELRDGLIWDAPIFGFVSPMINSFTPGFGNSRATAATVSYVMTNGVARTDSLIIDTRTLRLQYVGTVDLQQNVNANVTAKLLGRTGGFGEILNIPLWPISKIFECRVTGLISDPKVTPVLFSPFRSSGSASTAATPDNSPAPKSP